MNENDFVVGVLTYITCLREKKSVIPRRRVIKMR